MPKAILEFKLPDDNFDYKCANNGYAFYSILCELDNFLRENLKYEHKYKDADEALQATRNVLWELLGDEGLNLDE